MLLILNIKLYTNTDVFPFKDFIKLKLDRWFQIKIVINLYKVYNVYLIQENQSREILFV